MFRISCGVVGEGPEPLCSVAGIDLNKVVEEVSEFVVSYLSDEHNENPGCSSLHELYGAFGDLYRGLASGGDFQMMFQGECFKFEVSYKGIDNLLAAWRDREREAWAHGTEGPADGAIQEVVDEMKLTLPSFGGENGMWRMLIVADQQEPDPDYMRSNCSVNMVYYVNGKYVQWLGALGSVTVWQE